MRCRAVPLIGAVLVLGLTGCAGGQMSTSSDSPASTPSSSAPYLSPGAGPSATPVPSGDPVDVPDEYWTAIQADLTKRGVDGTPEVVSSQSVVWNDGSLGCGKPGQSYTQARIEGMQVIVSVDGATYDYRFGASATPVLCTT